MDLLRLPIEVLEHILCHLKPKDVAAVSQACKSLCVLSYSDKIWSRTCFNEYKIRLPTTKGFARKFYRKVLYKYGEFLGLWVAHADSYGGLLEVKYSDEKIIGVDLQPPKYPHVTHPMRPRTIFEIEINEQTDNVQISCCKNPGKKHACTLSYGEKSITPSSPRSFYLTRQCTEIAGFSDHQETEDFQHNLETWIADQSEFIGDAVPSRRAHLLYKYIVLPQFDRKTHYSRLRLPKLCNFKVPIKPGIFKGTYSAHGLQLVSLSYEADMKRVTVVKVTGDRYVPAGQITFRAVLPFCMHLSRAQQTNFESIREVEAVTSDVSWDELPSPQPFVLPEECIERYYDVPNQCIARFHGFGQTANEGFQNSSYVDGHWIIFNENLFGFLWTTLESLSLYHRVQESLVD